MPKDGRARHCVTRWVDVLHWSSGGLQEDEVTLCYGGIAALAAEVERGEAMRTVAELQGDCCTLSVHCWQTLHQSNLLGVLNSERCDPHKWSNHRTPSAFTNALFTLLLAEMSNPTPYLSLPVGGILTHIYGLPTLNPTDGCPEGLAVLFFLHGRFGSASESRFVQWAQEFVDVANAEREKAGGKGKRLVVCTFDQRNHGERTVDSGRNKGWKDWGSEVEGLDNEAHAVDMLAVQSESRSLALGSRRSFADASQQPVQRATFPS